MLASLATSVPAMPIARPTSAFFSAGASLVPSPVIGDDVALLLQQLRPSGTCRAAGPGPGRAGSRQPSPSARRRSVALNSSDGQRRSGVRRRSSRPISWPMARAVSTLSPVIIFTSMPGGAALATASFTSGAQRVADGDEAGEDQLGSSSSRAVVQGVLVVRESAGSSAWAKASVAHRLRRPRPRAAPAIAPRVRASTVATVPSAVEVVRGTAPASSPARPSPARPAGRRLRPRVVIRLRSDEKWIW